MYARALTSRALLPRCIYTHAKCETTTRIRWLAGGQANIYKHVMTQVCECLGLGLLMERDEARLGFAAEKREPGRLLRSLPKLLSSCQRQDFPKGAHAREAGVAVGASPPLLPVPPSFFVARSPRTAK